jgi:hypothetical protein
MNPRYPVYIISKGRWETRLTSDALEAMEVPYHIVIEPQEYEKYSAVIKPEKIYVLPFSNLGQGSIPARNWVWEHSLSIGAERHWILDDNMDGFVRLYNNTKIKVNDQHPDVVSITYKFKKWQHQVNYKPFVRNKLIKKEGVIIPEGVNNYGMILKEIA